MFQRLGPTLAGSPFAAEWQAEHFLKTSAPFAGSAAASRPLTGSNAAGAAGSAVPPASPSGTVTVAAWITWGSTSLSATIWVTSKAMPANRPAPTNLFVSSDDIRNPLGRHKFIP